MFQGNAFQASAFFVAAAITAFQPNAFQPNAFQRAGEPAFQPQAFQVDAFQTTGTLPPTPAPKVQPSTTGGWSLYNERELRKLLQRRLKRQEDEDRLEDALEALQALPAVDPKANELKRLQALVGAYAGIADADLLANRTQRALQYAQRSQTLLAYELALREIAKQLEEEEHAVLLTLAML